MGAAAGESRSCRSRSGKASWTSGRRSGVRSHGSLPDERIDVIHAHHYSPFVYAALARAWAPRVALVFTEHGRLSDAPPSSKRRLANQVLARVPHRVFAVSEDVKAHLVAEGFGAASVGVIYNGVEPGLSAQGSDRLRVRRDLGVGDGEFVVCTVARLDPVKDLETSLAAIAAMSSATRLVIVGDGPERLVARGFGHGTPNPRAGRVPGPSGGCACLARGLRRRT